MERLLAILSEIVPDVDYKKEKHLVSDEIFTSFDILQCSIACEDEFGVEIPPEAITAANFESADAIWKMLSPLIENRR